MSVAPELPPVFVTRRRAVLRAVPVDRTPAGVVALVEPRRPVGPGRLTVVPVARPTLDWDGELAGPLDGPLDGPLGGPGAEPGAGAGREHRPAAPVRLRPAGARVVRAARPGLRLTRRGRLVVGALIALAAGLLLVVAAVRVAALDGSAPVPASAPSQVVVAPGETLWSIAERVAPDRDPRPVVNQLRRLNNLPTGDVHTGQTLHLRTP